MSDNTSIEWTDATWNPVRGCSRISPGCGGPNHQGGCYAEKIAARFSGPGQPFEGFANRTAHGGAWTGKMALVESQLDQPLRWKKPRRIFVNSMSDLFHENLADEAIDKVFAVMALAPRHTFQVLTKRPERMRAYMSICKDSKVEHIVAAATMLNRFIDTPGDGCFLGNRWPGWPLPNVWLGVSVEDQERADERIPHLLATPAAKRFLSCEPLLGDIKLFYLKESFGPVHDALAGETWYQGAGSINSKTVSGKPKLDWVIVGGESGPNSRPMHPDWARALRDQCQTAGVPFFFKQWGEHGPGATRAWRPEFNDRLGTLMPVNTVFGAPAFVAIPSAETALVTLMEKFGKKAAGALLDGREWREFPAP